MNFRPGQPFVGTSAFAHKGGMHVHGVRKNAASYEHIDPATVGNERRVLVSELSGKSNIAEKLGEYGLEQDATLLAQVLDRVQDLENEGYQFEAAEASFVLLVERLAGRHRPWFERLGYHVSVAGRPGGEPTVDRGDGQAAGRRRASSTPSARATARSTPSTAPCARRSSGTFPGSSEMHLVDYKVRVINARAGTAARVRVVIESKDHDAVWGTVGVSENVIEASWLALVDAFEHKLSKDRRAAGERIARRMAATTARVTEETVKPSNDRIPRHWPASWPRSSPATSATSPSASSRPPLAIPEDQLWTKPFPFGNSVGHLVLHLTGNLNHYVGAMVAGTGYVRDREHEFTDPAHTRATSSWPSFHEAVGPGRPHDPTRQDEAGLHDAGRRPAADRDPARPVPRLRVAHE